MFRLWFVWVYIIKGEFVPFVRLASVSRLCLAYIFTLCGRKFSFCPKSFYIKGNKTAYLGFYCRANFYDNVPSFLYLIVKGLERLTTFSSRRANVQKTWFGDRSILWYKFLGTTLKNRILPDKNPCRSEPICGRDFYTDFFIP